jgi:hypothetical protein
MTIGMMERIVFKDDAIKLKRPRSYWVALPNENNLSLEKILKLLFNLN